MSNQITSPSTANQEAPVIHGYTTGRYLLVTGLLLLFGGLIWMVTAFGARGFKDIDAQRADQRYKIYDDVMLANQKSQNDPPSVLNKEQGKIRLPLTDAINLTLRDINQNKPHAAYPVQPTNPTPPAADAKPPVAQPPTTVTANNTVLPKQPDASASSAPNGGPSPSPSPAQGMTNPR